MSGRFRPRLNRIVADSAKSIAGENQLGPLQLRGADSIPRELHTRDVERQLRTRFRVPLIQDRHLVLHVDEVPVFQRRIRVAYATAYARSFSFVLANRSKTRAIAPAARSISSPEVCLPSENRTADLARSIDIPIASKTCEAMIEPTMQAEPLDAQTPSKSSAMSSVSESKPGKLTLSVFARRHTGSPFCWAFGKIRATCAPNSSRNAFCRSCSSAAPAAGPDTKHRGGSVNRHYLATSIPRRPPFLQSPLRFPSRAVAQFRARRRT